MCLKFVFVIENISSCINSESEKGNTFCVCINEHFAMHKMMVLLGRIHDVYH